MARVPPTDRHVTYQWQYRRCGKPACRTCQRGPGHGPYWFAYWYQDKKLRSAYIGKTRPSRPSPPSRPAAPAQGPTYQLDALLCAFGLDDAIRALTPTRRGSASALDVAVPNCALFGVCLESARRAGTTPYVVRWASHDPPPGPAQEHIAGLTRACARALAARLRELEIDPHPRCGPATRHD